MQFLSIRSDSEIFQERRLAKLKQVNMALINKVDMVCLSPVGYGV